MAICGWCQGTGTYYGKRCTCSSNQRRAYFAKAAKKKTDDMLPSVHKHKFEFLDRAGHNEWFMCPCGKTNKIYVD